jgi:hypothetical protein
MLTEYQRARIEFWFESEFKPKWVEVIETKRIERQRLSGEIFYAEVNATGALRDSIELVIKEDGFQILANSYIRYLITGRPPTTGGGDGTLVDKISIWQEAKGVGGSAYAITKSIHETGTSIWRKWKGQNSGLLDELTSKDFIDSLIKGILLNFEAETNTILNELVRVGN